MASRPIIGTLIALVALAGGGAIHFQRQAARETARAAELSAEFARLRTQAEQERTRADQLAGKTRELDALLGQAKTRATAAESKNTELVRQLSGAKTTLAQQPAQEAALLAEIDALRQQLRAANDASPAGAIPASRASLTAPTSGSSVTITAASAPIAPTAMPPASSATLLSEPPSGTSQPTDASTDAYRRRIAALESQLADLLTRVLAEPTATAPASPTATASSPYQVIRVGPDSAFVVVSYGALHGAAPGDELTLCRGTSVITRVQISDAREKFSLAQVLPAALKGQLQPGDFVLIAK